jgi:HlyD family secretion protein
MGRFEPMEPITRVSAPYIQGHPSTIAQIKVSEGDHVRAGQLIAMLAGREQLKAAVEEAKARVAAEQIRLEDAEAAPRASDVAAHAAEVERSQASVRFAQAEFERYQSLRTTRDVSASEVEQKQNALIDAQQVLEAAKARQAGLSERHEQQVQAAQSELDQARAQLDRARFDDASAEIHAPDDGVILHVRARPGEQAGPEGIVELARTAQMDVLAEVYETDIRRVRLGEHAEVTSNLLAAGTKLTGTVVDIGREVGRAAMTTGDTAAFADARVVLVRIRLSDGSSTSNLIDGKASVVFRP